MTTGFQLDLLLRKRVHFFILAEHRSVNIYMERIEKIMLSIMLKKLLQLSQVKDNVQPAIIRNAILGYCNAILQY